MVVYRLVVAYTPQMRESAQSGQYGHSNKLTQFNNQKNIYSLEYFGKL